MAGPPLDFSATSPFDVEEQDCLRRLVAALADSGTKDAARILETVAATVARVDSLAQALGHWPPIFSEPVLGTRRRSLETLVDLLASATDANFDMYLPTRALVGRALLMAEFSAWRQFLHVAEELLDPGDPAARVLQEEIDHWLHSCVHVKIAEELLGAVSMDSSTPRRVRTGAVRALSTLWENRLTYRVRSFFPLLEETWNARRRIRVSVGTMLGVSEIFRLMQAGCDERFVEYFCRPRMTVDEQGAFQEFLIGVPTEQIQSLEQLMAEEGRSSLSPEETAAVAYSAPTREQAHPGVRAYEFFRERYLQAAARRLKGLPGPKKTAEEYVMTYYLDQETAAEAPRSAGPA